MRSLLRSLFLLLCALTTTHLFAGTPRGYVTTPAELQNIAAKAAANIQPYKDAVLSLKNYANTGSTTVAVSTPNPTYWPHGTISGSQSCTATFQPAFIGNGQALVQAKAMVYHLTGDEAYAASARTQLIQLATTSGYGGTNYSGSNQCILNLSWYLPPWIVAADLLETYSGWTASDKLALQNWLATEIYRKVDYSDDDVGNNWGNAGSDMAAYIADYLAESGINMIDRNGASINAANAYAQANQHEIARLDNTMGSTRNCTDAAQHGIRPDGGMPEELVRGTTGCAGLWVVALDGSWSYQETAIASTFAHAELLWRRGDASLYSHVAASGYGSILKAIYFQIHNPNDVTKSVDWASNRKQGLEFVYRYWATQGTLDPYIGAQLGIGGTRVISGVNNPSPHFGTITHGFTIGESVSPPPTVTPPGGIPAPPPGQRMKRQMPIIMGQMQEYYLAGLGW